MAKFSADNQWYRARIESTKAGVAQVLFIDYGNREALTAASLAAMPAGYGSLPAFAQDYGWLMN